MPCNQRIPVAWNGLEHDGGHPRAPPPWRILRQLRRVGHRGTRRSRLPAL